MAKLLTRCRQISINFPKILRSERHFQTSAAALSADSANSSPPWAAGLKGKRAFVAGVGDDQGYGWAIAKALANSGVELVFGTWPPVLGIFRQAWKNGRYNKNRLLSNGKLLDVSKVYALDAMYDTPADVPPEVLKEKRYSGASVGPFTISEVAAAVKKDFGSIDILVHSLANGPEVRKALHETSRAGYLAALSASAYSNVSLLQHFAPLMPQGGSAVSLSYMASERVIPGYGGGMSSAKAALESDTRVLAWELGRKHGITVNVISAGALRSRAARAIGSIDYFANYERANAPLTKDLRADDVGQAALFLLSPSASSITGVTLYVDNGMHAMGLAVDSQSLAGLVGKANEKA